MRRNGNANTNRTFNPQNTKPPIPLDVDEVDAVLERFIRQKYDQQVFSGGGRRQAVRNDTGSTRSSEDQPPPLPPKPGKRFGFGLRSASSALPLQRNLPASPPHSPPGPNGFSGPPSPIRVNKQSRVFGASVGGGGGEMEVKLAQLKEMGFHDERRNAQILKGLGGNLERAIESLTRLGEGSAPSSRSRTPNPPRIVAVSQPLPSPPGTHSTGVVNGLSFTTNGVASQTSNGIQGQQPQTLETSQAQAYRNFTSPDPYQSQAQSYNPFDTSDQRQGSVSLENSFQGMQISQQPLFPNATGGYPSQQQQPQELRFQTMTPPVPQMPHQYLPNNPYMQQSLAPQNHYNPFFQSALQPVPMSSNPYALNNSNIQQPNVQSPNLQYQSEPYQKSMTQSLNNSYPIQSQQAYPTQVQQGSLQQQAYQQSAFQQPLQQQPQQLVQQHSTPGVYNPQSQYMLQSEQQPYQEYTPYQSQSTQPFNQHQPQPQPQPLLPQQTGRVDKTSILALYNFPNLAPPPLSTEQPVSASAESPAPVLPAGVRPIQRNATMPVQLSSGSRNPFQAAPMNPGAANGEPQGLFRHASQESVDVGAFHSGRHSPDAFASLSARFVR